MKDEQNDNPKDPAWYTDREGRICSNNLRRRQKKLSLEVHHAGELIRIPFKLITRVVVKGNNCTVHLCRPLVQAHGRPTVEFRCSLVKLLQHDNIGLVPVSRNMAVNVSRVICLKDTGEVMLDGDHEPVIHMEPAYVAALREAMGRLHPPLH